MNLVSLLDSYELLTRRVQQMIDNGQTQEPEFLVMCARKQAERFEIERFVAHIEKNQNRAASA